MANNYVYIIWEEVDGSGSVSKSIFGFHHGGYQGAKEIVDELNKRDPKYRHLPDRGVKYWMENLGDSEHDGVTLEQVRQLFPDKKVG